MTNTEFGVPGGDQPFFGAGKFCAAFGAMLRRVLTHLHNAQASVLLAILFLATNALYAPIEAQAQAVCTGGPMSDTQRMKVQYSETSKTCIFVNSVGALTGAGDHTFQLTHSGLQLQGLRGTGGGNTATGQSVCNFGNGDGDQAPGNCTDNSTPDATDFTAVFEWDAANPGTPGTANRRMEVNYRRDGTTYTFQSASVIAVNVTPEIDITSADVTGSAVADNVAHTITASKTAGAATTVTYVIDNSGTGDLSLTEPVAAAASSNVTINSITLGATTVNPTGGATDSTTLIVNYTPTIAGAFSFAIDMTNDDGDENPFTLSASGTATGAPEIDITSTDVTGSAVADNITHAITASKTAGAATTVTYVIDNAGTGDLSLTAPTNPANVSASSNVTINSITLGATTVNPTGGATDSTTLIVNYTPTIAGAFSFAIDMTNDDGDENPFTLSASGTATGAPEIDITSTDVTGSAVADNVAHTITASKTAGAATTVTYVIDNSGTGDLSLTEPIAAAVSSNVTINSITLGATTVNPTGGATDSTTLIVNYTPTIAGAFSFAIDMTNDDGDENPFTLSANGTATGTPEIEVTGNSVSITDGDTTPSTTDHTDFGPTDVAAGTVSRTFTVRNLGTATLNLGANAASLSGANAGDFSITTQPAATLAPSATTSVVVEFDPSASGARTATLSITNDDADEAPFDFAIAGEGSAGGSVTIVAKIDGGLTSIDLASATPQLAFSLPITGGQGSQTISNVPAGTHTITLPDLTAQGLGWTEVGCGGVGTVATTFSFDLAVGETVTCTIELRATQSITSQMIADFLGARNAQILSNRPGFSRRLNRLNGNQPQSRSAQVSLLGFRPSVPSPVDVAVTANTLSYAANISPQADPAAEAIDRALADKQMPDIGSWDIWTEGNIGKFDSQNGETGTLGIVHGGVDYLATKDILVGLGVQLDWFQQSFAATNGTVDGLGWMVGPYALFRLDENFYIDLQGAWGQSYNNISPFGTYQDQFRTDRALLSGALVGEFDIEQWSIRPTLSLSYLMEHQHAYKDTTGVTIPGQTIAQGELRFAPRLSYTYEADDGLSLVPWVELAGIYTFGETGAFSTNSLAAQNSGISAALSGGLDISLSGGAAISLSGLYGGLLNNTNSYGASLSLSAPIN